MPCSKQHPTRLWSWSQWLTWLQAVRVLQQRTLVTRRTGQTITRRLSFAKLTQERDEATRKYSESVGGFKRDLQEKLDQQRDKNKRLREQLAAKDAEISELQQNVQTTADALGHAHLELAAMKGEEA